MEQGSSKNKFCFWIIGILIVVAQGCDHLFGIYPITSNVYMMDSGTPKEKIIIFNSESKAWNIVSGIPVIPNNVEYGKKNAYEYVEEYSYDSEWLMAKTSQITDSSIDTRYWIVHIPNKEEHELDKITKATLGPLSRSEYDSIIVSKKIPRTL